MISKIISLAISALVFSLILGVFYISFRTFGPYAEMQFKRPLEYLLLAQVRCEDRDAIVSGVMDKTAYGEGEAEFLGLTLLSTNIPHTRLPYERVNLGDLSPESRPAGIQTIAIRVLDGCGVNFTAHTRHESPITGLVLPMSFGPFGSFEMPPR